MDGASGDFHTIETAALVVLGLLTLFMYLKLRKERRQPYGYLYRPKGKRLGRFKISTGICRIGRHPNNELRLNDKSVSRFHAELIRNHNGTFSIYDTESKNGIRVGMRPVNSSVLREGDLIDVGKVRLKFSRRPRDYNVHRNTVVLENQATRFETRRRREQRQDLVMQVRLYNDESGWTNGWMRNIGRDGAFIETEARLAARRPVDIVVAVTDAGMRRWLHLTGEIVWSDAKGVGISFTDRDPGILEKILSSAAANG